ncbi:hypothetical protein [Tenacibaculum sp.]|uniref:hypothetical protein n=1 Tax=Tenacibaculum sp. TaxID=1906242 RepID=UPI003D0EB0AC
MKCKVTVSGPNKARFEKLTEKFGQVIALESIYDSDGSASIEGFTSDVEIANRVNSISFSVLNGLREQAGGLSVLDLRDSDLTQSKVQKALDRAYNDLEVIAVEGIRDYLSGDKAEGAYIAQKAYVALKTFDQLGDKVIERLENFGLKLSTIDSNLSEEYQEEYTDSTQRDKIYSKSAVETSRLDSVSPQIKLYIASLPKQRYKETADGVEMDYVLDDIGMKQPIDFNEAYSTLTRSLSNIDTVEEMMEKLKDLGPEIPFIQEVYEDLESNLLEPVNAVMHKNQRVNNFKNAFYGAFRNTHNKFITATIRVSESIDELNQKVRTVKSQILNTDKRRLHNEIKKKWVQENIAYRNISEAERLDIWSRKDNEGHSMKNFFSKTNLKSNIQKLNTAGNKRVLNELSKHLSTAGINISPEALGLMRKKYNRGKNKKFGDKIMTEAGSVKSILEGFWALGNTNIIDGENSTIVELAKLEAEVTKDLSGGSFMNGEGNLVYSFNLPTAASDLFDDFSKKSERFEDFKEDPLFGNYRIIKEFEKENSRSKNKMEMASFDTMYFNDKSNGVPFSSLDPLSSMATRLMLHMNYSGKGKAHNSYGWYMVPTPADRSGSRVFKMPRVSDISWTVLGLEEGDFKDWLKDTTVAEFNRIKEVRQEYEDAIMSGDRSKLIDNYHIKGDKLGNGGWFNAYPELNNFIKEGIYGFDPTSKEVMSVLEEAVKNQIDADIAYLEQIGLIETAGMDYSKIKLTKLAKEFVPKETVKKDEILSFISNSIIANHELSNLFNGDLAFFSATDYENNGSTKKQFSNANKRAGLADTPGVKLNVGKGASNDTFKAAFVEDINDSSEFLESYIAAIGEKQGKKYGKIEVTDGQGLVSLDRYADILNGMGQLTPSMISTIEELKKPEPDWNKVTEVIQPVKGFLQGQRYDYNFGRIMPKNLKYSLFPMIPSNLLDNLTMAETFNKMLDAGVDELVFTTGAKFGAYNVNKLSDAKFKTVDLSNSDWRMPQVVPYKRKTMENFGTQIRKLIMGNLNKLANYGNKTGEQLQSDYQKAISLNMADSLKSLYQELSENGVPSVKKIAKKVLGDIQRNAYKTTPDFIEQALQVVELENGNWDTRIPMSFPSLKHRVESSLNSAIRKAVTKQSIPGFSAVQYTGLGFNKSNIQVTEGLKFVREENGKILPAEIKVSPQYFIQSLKKKEQTPEVIKAINQLQQGVLDISKFSDEVLEGVIYRIPTQGKNSALPVKIVAFAPESQGSIICIPAEITVQSGSDYDIDKVYLEMRHFAVQDGKFTALEESLDTREGRDNMIVNTHFNVLTSPEHFKELITPNHSDTLKKMAEKMDDIFSSEVLGRKWSSIATQDDFRDKNQAGGVMIGVFSIANTAHALFQELNVQLNSRGREVETKSDVSKVNKLSILPEEQYYSGNLNITKLGKNGVFVFGANSAGGHGGGTAAIAQTGKPGMSYDVPKTKLGKYAIYGEVGYMEGTKGASFGLVTKSAEIKDGKLKVGGKRSISKENIIENIEELYGYARGMTEKTFYVAYTNSGTNMNGYSSSEMAEMFSLAGEIPTNVKFSNSFKNKEAITFTQGTGVKINGNMVNSLSLVKNQQGGLISDDHMENQTAAVDNASNPYLGSLNINTITGPVYNFLIEAGSGIEYAAKLVGSPVIRRLTTEVRKFETLYGSEGAFQEALKLMQEEYGLDIESSNVKDFDVPETILDASLGSFSKGQDNLAYDNQILSAFLTFRKYGNDMVQVQQALQTDNIGAHQTLAANFIHTEKLATVPGTKSNEDRKMQYPNDDINEVSTIKIDRESYRNHSMEAFETYGLHAAVKLVGSVIDDTKAVQQKVLKDYTSGTTKLVDSDLRILMNDFYSFLYLNKETGLNSVSPIAEWLDSDSMTELLVGENSVGKQVIRMQKEERAKTKEDLTYTPNEFVANLTVELLDETTGYDLVKFNNTVSRALSSEQKTTLSNELVRLFDSNPDLARDLVLYSLGMDGFNRHTNSFGDYIHASIYEMVENSKGENMVEFYRNSRSYFNSIQDVDTDTFMNRFLRNRANDLKGIPDLSKRKRTDIRKYLKENKHIKYFKAMTPDGISIAISRQEDSGIFDVVGSPLGHSNVQIEYQTGMPMREVKDIQDILKSKEISGDVVSNGKC